jgi:hypothetical protein
METAYKVSSGQFRRLIKTILLYENKIRNKQSLTLNATDIREIDNAGIKGSE